MSASAALAWQRLCCMSRAGCHCIFKICMRTGGTRDLNEYRHRGVGYVVIIYI